MSRPTITPAFLRSFHDADSDEPRERALGRAWWHLAYAREYRAYPAAAARHLRLAAECRRDLVEGGR